LMARRTTHDWMEALEGAGVPCGPINSVDQVFAEPQAVARGLVVEQARKDLVVPVRSVASPIRMSATPVVYERAPPALGADTREVLEALGLRSRRPILCRERGHEVLQMLVSERAARWSGVRL